MMFHKISSIGCRSARETTLYINNYACKALFTHSYYCHRCICKYIIEFDNRVSAAVYRQFKAAHVAASHNDVNKTVPLRAHSI